MSPRFAGTLMGITNGVSNVMSIIAPLAAGALLRDEVCARVCHPRRTLIYLYPHLVVINLHACPQTDPGEWQKVFYLSAAVYVAANLVFVIFGSSARQTWDRLPDGTTSLIYILSLLDRYAIKNVQKKFRP